MKKIVLQEQFVKHCKKMNDQRIHRVLTSTLPVSFKLRKSYFSQSAVEQEKKKSWAE